MFDDVQELYQQVILDHGRKPRHGTRLQQFDATAKGDNPMCGDRVQVWLRYGEDGAIAATGFEARGCAISVASADLMAEAVEGASPAQVRDLSQAFATMVAGDDCPDCAAALQARLDTLRPLSGVRAFPSRRKCATLPWHALVAALDGVAEATSERGSGGTITGAARD